MIIGKGGSEVDSLKKALNKLVGYDVQVNVSEIKRPALEKQTQHRIEQAKKKTKQIFNVLTKPGESLKQYGEKVKKTIKTKDVDHIKFKKDLQSLIPKESIKLKLNIEGTTVLTAEGRYVNHHDVFFYQFIASTYEPFHYYIKLRKKPSIALNMNFFNKRVDPRLSYLSILISLVSGILFFPSTDFQSSILVGNLLPIEFFSSIIATNLLFISFVVAIVTQLLFIMVYSLRSSFK